MENYEFLGVIGEGTYGVVMKACHKETGQVVAIKKFKESDEDEQVRKTSLREVRVLKQLRHDNVITLLEVFRRKGRLHLVFEYVEKTILEVLETRANGLEDHEVRRYTYQLLRGVEYCHTHNIIHRDIKPENILISKNGALKLCDFGFARTMSIGGKYTDYVATRWYRSPELLVGDVEYGKGVDVWAIGCIFAEISNGQPLFPGESDVDQLAHIMRCFGRLTNKHSQIFRRNPLYVGVELPNPTVTEPLDARFPHVPKSWLGFLKACLKNDPEQRETCASLMSLPYFTERNFRNDYEQELRMLFEKESTQSGIKRPQESNTPTLPQPAPTSTETPPALPQALPPAKGQHPQQGGALGTMWSQYLASANPEPSSLPGLGNPSHSTASHQPHYSHAPPLQPQSQHSVGNPNAMPISSNPYPTAKSHNSMLGGFPKAQKSSTPNSHHAYSSNYSTNDPMMVTGATKAKKNSGSGSSLFPTLSGTSSHGPSSQGQPAPTGLSGQLNYKKKPQKRNVLSTLSLTAFGGSQQGGASGVNPYGRNDGFEVTGSGSNTGAFSSHSHEPANMGRRGSKPWGQ